MSLKFAILGFLEIEPATGYTLAKRFEASVGSFWHASLSQIYRDLSQMEKAGWVSAELVPQIGRPDKRIHGITEAGKTALQIWLNEPLQPLQVRDPFLLKFALMANHAPAQMEQLLKEYEQQVREREAIYRQREVLARHDDLARSASEARVWHLTLQYGLAWCAAQLAWVNEARSSLQKEKLK